MSKYESSLHLYQPPVYRGTGGVWRKSFIDAVCDCNGKLTWDPAAILGIMGYNYTSGDRTLVNEIKRQPWLSEIGPNNEAHLQKIPGHGRLWKDSAEIAENLGNLLYDEAFEVCSGRKEIYVLLSGGLDSRIIAGIMAKLYRDGKLATKPIGVTWGMEDSRDVVYGRMVANISEFEWIHINISHEDLAYSTSEMAVYTAALVPPIHLHGMHWFKNVSKDALVLAGAYGDSVGRAEFSGRTVLELNYLNRPRNPFGLVRDEVLACAYDGVLKDLKALHDRSPGQPCYVICEHEMQGHYMRNMISHAMNTINQHCCAYQMFTHPKVYSYMWSIHPAIRNNSIYAKLLERLDTRLARMPWARTNRSLHGKTIGAKTKLRKVFHDYGLWTSGPLFDRFNQYIDPQWFGETGIFDCDRIQHLSELIQRGKGYGHGVLPHEKWLWLASFRRVAERIEELGKAVALGSVAVDSSESVSYLVSVAKTSFVRRIFDRSIFLYKLASCCVRRFEKIRTNVRRKILCYRAVREYPPEKG